jgi:hypothetical protein
LATTSSYLRKTIFYIQIEKVSDANGKALGLGEIRSVHLDAGKRGKFEV